MSSPTVLKAECFALRQKTLETVGNGDAEEIEAIQDTSPLVLPARRKETDGAALIHNCCFVAVGSSDINPLKTPAKIQPQNTQLCV
ncbi:hypothetical protein CJ030_MR5G017233 [Morella rubra]|uniref:Uncharacterized protein n=1 Tax=Morella rubra TaxID=262757 RepID=A0A6A1VTH6_9ROSI|nr:hypothetical protein CJ030_MR5G017233 [Morella rubra]